MTRLQAACAQLLYEDLRDGGLQEPEGEASVRCRGETEGFLEKGACELSFEGGTKPQIGGPMWAKAWDKN